MTVATICLSCKKLTNYGATPENGTNLTYVS